MRIPEIQDYLVDHYHGQNRETAVMMLGPPGIGKSVAGAEGAERIADMVDLPFVEYSDQKGEMIMNSDEKYFVYHSLPLVECEPSDLVGIPRDRDNGYVKFKPLLWARVMAENPGILMLDDFLDVQRYDLFSAAYKITLERRAGYLKLSDGVMVVGASNTPEESPLSQMLPAPLANRMNILNATSPTTREWGKWMNDNYGNDWDKRILSFLERYKMEGYLLQVPKETEVLHNFPTPRTMTKLSLELNESQHEEVIKGLVGPEVGQKLIAYLKLDVDLDELIENPLEWDNLERDSQFMICTELANWFQEASEPRKGFSLLDEMSEDSRQFPTVTFLSMDTSKLEDLFRNLFQHDEKYVELANEVIEDKEAIR